MGDASVSAALRSDAPLVVVEAPAGCGKTFQGAAYAHDTAKALGNGRALILTHTHAACDVFASRTKGLGSKVEISTIDSLIIKTAAAYHKVLELPADVGAWARREPTGYDVAAKKVAALLKNAPFVAKSLATRYPVVICDEHQDACLHRHNAIYEIYKAGAALRVFADPMQHIHGERNAGAQRADRERWEALKAASKFERLDHPHRWAATNSELGSWILEARSALEAERPIDLRGDLPSGMQLIIGENTSQSPQGFALSRDQARPIRSYLHNAEAGLVVCRRTADVSALRSFFGRQYPIWEGHTRDALSDLVSILEQHDGDPSQIGSGVVAFFQSTCVGFTQKFSAPFLQEIEEGCVRTRRLMPKTVQNLSKLICDEPDHKGVAKVLREIERLRNEDNAFSEIVVDHVREYREAMRLDDHANPGEAIAEQSRRRQFARTMPPPKALSTIHKAKGLEFQNVIILPCDRKHFGDTHISRCLMYVALSRATTSLRLVVSRNNPSPLFQF